MKMNRSTFVASAGIVACAIVGLGAGTAFAGTAAPLSAPAGVAAPEGVSSTPMPDPSYSVNAAGESYGSLLDSNSPENDPDLVLVMSEEGKEGYAKKADLDKANGSAAATTFKSPDEALAWQKERLAQGDIIIPVYKEDGKTVIGTFVSYAAIPETSEGR